MDSLLKELEKQNEKLNQDFKKLGTKYKKIMYNFTCSKCTGLSLECSIRQIYGVCYIICDKCYKYYEALEEGPDFGCYDYGAYEYLEAHKSDEDEMEYIERWRRKDNNI